MIVFSFLIFLFAWGLTFAVPPGLARADVIMNSGGQSLSLDTPGDGDLRFGTPPRAPAPDLRQDLERNPPYGIAPEVYVPWVPRRGGAHPPAHVTPPRVGHGPAAGPRSERAVPLPQGGKAAQASVGLRPELLANLVSGLAPARVRVAPKPQAVSLGGKGGAKSGGKPSLSGMPLTRSYPPPNTPDRGAPERKVYPSQRPPQLGVNPAQPVYPGEKPPAPRK